jgi:hypothetical protein
VDIETKFAGLREIGKLKFSNGRRENWAVPVAGTQPAPSSPPGGRIVQPSSTRLCAR